MKKFSIICLLVSSIFISISAKTSEASDEQRNIIKAVSLALVSAKLDCSKWKNSPKMWQIRMDIANSIDYAHRVPETVLISDDLSQPAIHVFSNPYGDMVTEIQIITSEDFEKINQITILKSAVVRSEKNAGTLIHPQFVPVIKKNLMYSGTCEVLE